MRATKTHQNSKGPVALSRAGWIFQDCPDGQVNYCHQFEFAREAFRLNPKVDLPKWILECDPDLKTPFLELPKRLRDKFERDYKRHLEELKQFTPTKLLADGQVFDGDLAYLGDLRVDPDKLDETRHVRVKSERGLIDFVAFRIEWRFSDRDLLAAMKMWLAQNRPEKKRGNIPLKSLHADLRALGVLRLRNLGYTAEEVVDLMKKARCYEPISSTSKVYAASKRAKKVVDEFVDRYSP